MKYLLPIALSVALLTGCSLIPKPVEFGQDKVKKFPEPPVKMLEYQKEAAYLAKEKTQKTVDLILQSPAWANQNVISNARDAEKLADSVSYSVGVPSEKAVDADKASDNLRHASAKLERKVDAFKDANDVNAGKKIEGSGFLQIPYVVWVGLIALVVIVGWHLAKLALTLASAANPGAAVGVGAMNVAGSLVGKGFQQIVAGGEAFKNWVSTEITDSGLQQKILNAFTTFHKQAQDQDVKAVVNTLTDNTPPKA